MPKNAMHERQEQAAERKLLAWLPTEEPGATLRELEKSTGLSLKTLAKHLKSLTGRGKVIRTRVKRRVPTGETTDEVEIASIRGDNATVARMIQAGTDQRYTTVAEWRYALKTARVAAVVNG